MSTTSAYFSPVEAAAMIGIHRNTLDAHIKRDHIAVRRLGSRIGISAEVISRIEREGLPAIAWPPRPRRRAEEETDVSIKRKLELNPTVDTSAPEQQKPLPSHEANSTTISPRNQEPAGAAVNLASSSLVWRGIDLTNCSEAQWRHVTGLFLLPPSLRARLSYIAGTDPNKPRLLKRATPEELGLLSSAFQQYAAPVSVTTY